MSEIEGLLEKQARQQKNRKALPWPEKIRMAERARPSAGLWRGMAGKKAFGARESKDGGDESPQ